jgi:hypothetical protein
MRGRKVAEGNGVAVYEYRIDGDEAKTWAAIKKAHPDRVTVTIEADRIRVRVPDDSAVDGDVRTRAAIREEYEAMAMEVGDAQAFEALAVIHGEEAVTLALEEVK